MEQLIRMFNILIWFLILETVAATDVSCQHSSNANICDTENCNDIAQVLLSAMDTSVHPCKNFYQFVCGKWIDKNPIPEDEPMIDQMSKQKKVVRDQVLDFLTNTSYSGRTKSLETARQLFKMCMDIKTLEEEGIKPILDVLNDMGGWPILYSLNDPNYRQLSSWQSHLIKMYNILPHRAFYNAVYGPGSKQSRIQRLMFVEPSQNLDSDEDKNGQTVQNYKAYIYNTVKYICTGIQCTVSESQLEQDIDEIIDLEMELSSINTPIIHTLMSEDDSKNVMTIEKFQKFYDNNGGKHPNTMIDWLKIMKLEVEGSRLEISKTEEIIVHYLGFFKKLTKTFKKTKPRTLINYMVWTLIRKIIQLSDSKGAKDSLLYQRKLHNLKKEKTREDTCLGFPNLVEAISYEYVDRYFSKAEKIHAAEIVDKIIKQTRENVKLTKWMDSKSKAKLVDKIDGITKLIGYPDFYSVSAIDQMYSGYELGPNYINSVLKLLKFTVARDLAKVREPFTKNQWIREPTNAIIDYVYASNSINVPAAHIKPPVFDPDRPDLLNIAILGYIIAHEISHSFDTTGLQYNRYGNKKQLWSNKMIKIYKKTSECFIKQFSNYPIKILSRFKKVYTDGKFTLNENIADTNGLQIAFDTFNTARKQNGSLNIRLPGLDTYTPEQLFFIMFASFYCSNISPEAANDFLKSDLHAAHEVRVQGTVSNIPEFAEAFNCKIGDPMHPPEKCRILKI